MLAELAFCVSIHVAADEDGPSTVFRVELPAGVARPLGVLPVRVTALGYSAAQDRLYGVTEAGRFVVLDRNGHLLETRRSPEFRLRAVQSGAVVGDRFLVRSGSHLMAVDVDPASPDYLTVVDDTHLSPLGYSVDDFDLNPADGLLYGVSTSSDGARVVTLDPVSGSVREVPGTGDLPGGDGYGAVVFGRDNALYATNNRTGGRSTLWRIALDGSGGTVPLAYGGPLHTIDASGCLSVPPVPEEPPPSPPPSPTPVPPVPGVPAPENPPPVPAEPTSTVPPTSPTPTPVPPSSAAAPPADSPEPPTSREIRVPEERAAAAESGSARLVRDQRRWSLAVVILVLAAGAMARASARRR
ncbi:hypothetical protein GCM10022243_25960 [Saccharothrix violaceirubra]|uniref:DUF6923 domain-containing protein n=1 Tax=Saccharothrix violaceirubra TaxID=413306 RepID=A0A7W7T6G7_9PSEU|nr:hypothetical protein [Saccharothrix violaceirubra]MBB4967211.1 hypothetical protein [Saccharothrix violaceirubra]